MALQLRYTNFSLQKNEPCGSLKGRTTYQVEGYETRVSDDLLLPFLRSRIIG